MVDSGAALLRAREAARGRAAPPVPPDRLLGLDARPAPGVRAGLGLGADQEADARGRRDLGAVLRLADARDDQGGPLGPGAGAVPALVPQRARPQLRQGVPPAARRGDAPASASRSGAWCSTSSRTASATSSRSSRRRSSSRRSSTAWSCCRRPTRCPSSCSCSIAPRSSRATSDLARRAAAPRARYRRRRDARAEEGAAAGVARADRSGHQPQAEGPALMARRTFNSIESTADQAEALVQQGRWVDAERHYRDLIGQTHVINYEYDDWLRRLGEIYRHLGRGREASFVYLYLHYFDMARGQLVADEHVALRARLAEIEKKWAEAATLYQRARLPVHAAVGVRARQAVPGGGRRVEEPGPRAGAGAAAVRGGARPLQLRAGGGAARGAVGRGAPRADREPAQARAGGRRLRAGRRARARVRLLPDPAQARQGELAVREPRRGLRQLHPRAARGQPQVLRPPVLRGLHQARARARRAPRGGHALPGGGGVRGARRAAVRPPLPAQERAHLDAVRRHVRRDRRPGADDGERAARRGVAALGRRRLPSPCASASKLAGLELPERARKRFSTIAQRYRGSPRRRWSCRACRIT